MPHLPIDSRVHHQVMLGFARHGAPPDVAGLAAALAASPDEVAASLRRLDENHGLALHPGTLELWLAHPFTTSPGGVWVEGPERGWWSPCLWCAFGLVALGAPDATLHCRIGGEAEPLAIPIRGGRVAGDDLVVHFPTPPRDAWNNVVAFCAGVQPFRAPADVEAWCTRHRRPRGAVLTLPQIEDLGRRWYGRHFDEDWVKWTPAEAQAVFDQVGLTGDHWRVPDRDRF